MPSISEALCREMRDSFQQLFRKLRPRRRLRDIELAEESGHWWSERQGSWCEGLRRRLSQALRREQLAGVQAGNRRVQHVETDRREKVGRYEEAERRDRHCATDAERYGHLRVTDAERHREDLLHEIRDRVPICGVSRAIAGTAGHPCQANATLARPLGQPPPRLSCRRPASPQARTPHSAPAPRASSTRGRARAWR